MKTHHPTLQNGRPPAVQEDGLRSFVALAIPNEEIERLRRNGWMESGWREIA